MSRIYKATAMLFSRSLTDRGKIIFVDASINPNNFEGLEEFSAIHISAVSHYLLSKPYENDEDLCLPNHCFAVFRDMFLSTF